MSYKRQFKKEYVNNFQASHDEKEYFNRIKRAGNIFKKSVSKGGVITTREYQKLGKGFKSKGWKADTAWDIKKEKIMFKSGGVIQSLGNINPQSREKKCELS